MLFCCDKSETNFCMSHTPVPYSHTRSQSIQYSYSTTIRAFSTVRTYEICTSTFTSSARRSEVCRGILIFHGRSEEEVAFGFQLPVPINTSYRSSHHCLQIIHQLSSRLSLRLIDSSAIKSTAVTLLLLIFRGLGSSVIVE